MTDRRKLDERIAAVLEALEARGIDSDENELFVEEDAEVVSDLQATLAGQQLACDATDFFEPAGFETLALLGKGGMGTVYLARQHEPSRLVAIKVMDPSADVRRFQLESTLQSRLDHPNIVSVYSVDRWLDRPYIVMQFVAGSSLAEVELGDTDAIDVLIKVADALQYAHEQGVIHRDVKPANVLFNRQRKPFLSDFGLAKFTKQSTGITQTGLAVGSPQYMSPEQLQSGVVGPASDIFSFGSLAYFLLSGAPPFDATQPIDLAQQITHHEPASLAEVRPGIDKGLESIVMRCLSKNPADRYPSAGAVRDALRSFLARNHRAAQARKRWIAVLSVAVFCGLAVVIWGMNGASPSVGAIESNRELLALLDGPGGDDQPGLAIPPTDSSDRGRLLRAWMLYRENQFGEALDIVRSVDSDQLAFFRAMLEFKCLARLGPERQHEAKALLDAAKAGAVTVENAAILYAHGRDLRNEVRLHHGQARDDAAHALLDAVNILEDLEILPELQVRCLVDIADLQVVYSTVEAINNYQKALRISDGIQKDAKWAQLTAEIHRNLSDAFARRGRWANAAAGYEEMLKLNEDYPEAGILSDPRKHAFILNGLAHCYLQSDEPHSTHDPVALATKANQLTSFDNANYRTTLRQAISHAGLDSVEVRNRIQPRFQREYDAIFATNQD